MNDMHDITGPIDYSCYEPEQCFFRLPCGICTRTNQPCPISPQTVKVTWDVTTGGNQ